MRRVTVTYCDECGKEIIHGITDIVQRPGKPDLHFHHEKWDYKKDKAKKSCSEKWKDKELAKITQKKQKQEPPEKECPYCSFFKPCGNCDAKRRNDPKSKYLKK